MGILKHDKEIMSEKEFVEYGKLQMELLQDAKDTKTCQFIEMALRNMEILQNIRKDINALETFEEDEVLDEYGNVAHFNYIDLAQVNDLLDLHMEQDWGYGIAEPSLSMEDADRPVMAENENGRVVFRAFSDRDELCVTLFLRENDGRYNGSTSASLQTNIPCSFTVDEVQKIADYTLETFSGVYAAEKQKGTATCERIKECFIDTMMKAEDHYNVLQRIEDEIER